MRNSSPRNLGLYRDFWLPLGLSDAGAFLQVLASFSLHLEAVYSMTSPVMHSSIYHLQALKCVNARLSNPLGAVDGLVTAVLALACHSVSISDNYNAYTVPNSILNSTILANLRTGIVT